MIKDYKAYKTISEVADLLKLVNNKNGRLATHTLRFWEKQFKQIRPKILAGNRRYYDQRTIDKLKKIKYLLKDKGMTIEGVKKQLLKDKTTVDEFDKVSISTIKNLKSKLLNISNKLKVLKEN